MATRSPSRSTPRRRAAARISGAHRHLRRRRHLRHRRQPGRQRQLRGRHPGPAVLRRRRHPDASPSPRPRPARRSWGRTYTVDGERRGKWQPGHLLDRRLGEGSCSISGATVTFVAVGTCVIDANQAGNANYEAATQVQQSFAVARAPRASPSPRPRPTPRSWEATYTVDGERRGQWQPGHLLDRPLGEGSCSISGATVTFVAVGTCVIDANQAGNASYEAATQVQQSFAVLASGSPPTGSWNCTSATAGTCPYSEDATNFVGQNNTNDPNGTGLGTVVNNDLWSPISGETQTLHANSAQNWEVVNNTPTNPSGSVTTFPNAWVHGYTGVLDDYTSLTSTASFSMPDLSNIRAHGMWDNFLSAPTDADGISTYEIMIQFYRVHDGSCATSGTWPNKNWVITATGVTFPSVNGSSATQPWMLCQGQVAHNSDGTCPATGLQGTSCGALVWKPGTNESDDDSCNGGTQTSTCSITINYKAMVQWLETHDPPGETYPYVAPGSSVTAMGAGFEIQSTGGVSETFAGNGFQVNASGAPTPPTTAPTGFSTTTTSGTCTLHWTSTGAPSYDVYSYGGGSSGVWRRVTTNSITLTGSGTFYAEVAQSNTGGPGPWSTYQTCATG